MHGDDSRDWRPIHDLIYGHRVGAFLRSQGYAYVHFGSWHPSTRDNPQATRNVNYYTAVPRSTMEPLRIISTRPHSRSTSSMLWEARRMVALVSLR